MKVSELGEFGLIDLVAGMVEAAKDKEAAAWRQLVLGIGDDAAAWRADTSIQLATVDALVQDIHFTLETTHSTGSGQAIWEELGWKALAINLSDIAAMGGIPRYALVSLTLPGETNVADVTALYKGMIELAKKYEVAIIGGNMSSAPIVTVHTTVLGSAINGEKMLLTRSSAKPGDKIAVTGYLGGAAGGLEMLTKHLKFGKKDMESLRRAFSRPEPRVSEGQLLVKQGVRAGMDISDGLLSDLRHICQASKVGARVEFGHVPVHPAVKANFGDRALELAVAGGEDYELLFTASEEVIEKVKAALSTRVTVIGEITAAKPGEITLVDRKGKSVDLSRMGWNHFAKK